MDIFLPSFDGSEPSIAALQYQIYGHIRGIFNVTFALQQCENRMLYEGIYRLRAASRPNVACTAAGITRRPEPRWWDGSLGLRFRMPVAVFRAGLPGENRPRRGPEISQSDAQTVFCQDLAVARQCFKVMKARLIAAMSPATGDTLPIMRCQDTVSITAGSSTMSAFSGMCFSRAGGPG